jgi:hypothetical protein
MLDPEQLFMPSGEVSNTQCRHLGGGSRQEEGGAGFPGGCPSLQLQENLWRQQCKGARALQ